MRKAALLLLAVSLSACGQKGPLYLPEQKAGAKPPPSSTPVPRTHPDNPMGDPPATR